VITQTAQFMGINPEALYGAYLSSKEHAAMTADNRPAVYYRPGEGELAHGEEGDELQAFGFTGPDGVTRYSLTARIIQLVPKKVIVLTWKNQAWNLALDPNEVTDMDSMVVLTFQKNPAGAEIQLVQANVPEYKVHIPDTGETGSLHSVVNTHWNLLYWEPMKRYFRRLSMQKRQAPNSGPDRA